MTEPVLTRPEWMQCAAFLTAGIGRPIPEAQVAAYFDLLNDIPFEVLKVACKRAIQQQEENWLPAVGLIRRHASEVTQGVLPLSCQAWGQLFDAYRYAYSPEMKSDVFCALPEFTRMVLVSLGGWSSYERSQTVDRWDQKFMRAYDAMAKREMESRKLSPQLRSLISGNDVVTPKLPSLRPSWPKRPDITQPAVGEPDKANWERNIVRPAKPTPNATPCVPATPLKDILGLVKKPPELVLDENGDVPF